MKQNYRILALIFFIMAVFLRGLLCWFNHPLNSFDNHYEPIFLIMENGSIPAKDACFQCYHPPVFYFISATIGIIAVYLGAGYTQVLKLLQFVCCFYGILTVGIIYFILKKVQLSDFSRIIAFGTVCFLPRHIYMSALHSNDTIAYLFVAICIYLLLVAFERKFTPIVLIILSMFMSLAIFTKYTSLVILPVSLSVLLWALFKRINMDWRKFIVSTCLVFVIPLSLFSTYAYDNVIHYGNPLPWNRKLFDPTVNKPREQERPSFFTFNLGEFIKSPILAPGKLSSFWTLVYSSTWFDTEPKFLYFTDSNTDWWDHYYAWLKGERDFPGENPARSTFAMLTGSSLIILGLVPLLFIFLGGWHYFFGSKIGLPCWNGPEATKMIMFPALLAANIAGMVAITLQMPVFVAMKATYFLNSLPAFAVFLGLGLMSIESYKIIKRASALLFGGLFGLVTVHIIHLSYAMMIRGQQLFSG